MEYYIKEIIDSLKDARYIATSSMCKILDDKGVVCIDYDVHQYSSNLKKIVNLFFEYSRFKKITSKFNEKDVLYIQTPFMNTSLFHYKILKRLRKKGVIIVNIVHDLNIYREHENIDNIKLNFREKSIIKELNICNYNIVCEGFKSKIECIKTFTNKQSLITYDSFPYDKVTNYKSNININNYKTLMIAGNLNSAKSGYISSLPNISPYIFDLYGKSDLTFNESYIHYHGFVDKAQLEEIFMNHGFSVIWDGDSSEGLKGTCGQYLLINTPFKLTTSLALGVPIIVSSKSYWAKKINEIKCGVAVDKLIDIKNFLDNLTYEEYLILQKNTEKFGNDIRNATAIINALNEAENRIK